MKLLKRREMNVFLGNALVKGFEISRIGVYAEEGKDIVIQKVEKTFHQEDCWKDWLCSAGEEWKDKVIFRLLIVLSCGHYFSNKCFFEHSFDRCPHCNFRITEDDKKSLCIQLYKYINKIFMSKNIGIKKDAMYLLRSLLETNLETDWKRWTKIVCDFYNYRSTTNIPSKAAVPALIVLNNIIDKYPTERGKIFDVIPLENILWNAWMVARITQDFTFLSHLDFLANRLLFCSNDDYDENLEELEELEVKARKLERSLTDKFRSDTTTMLFRKIYKNIADEKERNIFMRDVGSKQNNSDDESKSSQENIGDYDLRQYRDEQYDSDDMITYD